MTEQTQPQPQSNNTSSSAKSANGTQTSNLWPGFQNFGKKANTIFKDIKDEFQDFKFVSKMNKDRNNSITINKENDNTSSEEVSSNQEASSLLSSSINTDWLGPTSHILDSNSSINEKTYNTAKEPVSSNQLINNNRSMSSTSSFSCISASVSSHGEDIETIEGCTIVKIPSTENMDSLNEVRRRNSVIENFASFFDNLKLKQSSIRKRRISMSAESEHESSTKRNKESKENDEIDKSSDSTDSLTLLNSRMETEKLEILMIRDRLKSYTINQSKQLNKLKEESNLQEISMTLLKDTNGKALDDNHKLSNKVKELELQLKSLEASSISKEDILEKEIATSQEKVKTLQQLLTDSNHKVITLEAKLTQQFENKLSTQLENKSLKEKLEAEKTKTEKYLNLKKDYIDAMGKVKTLNEEKEEMLNEMKFLKESNTKEVDDQYKQLSEKLEEVVKSLNQSEAQLSSLKISYQDLESVNQFLSDKLNKLSLEFYSEKEILNKSEESKNLVSKLEIHNKTLMDQHNQMSEQIAQQKALLEELEKERSHHQEELEDVKSFYINSALDREDKLETDMTLVLKYHTEEKDKLENQIQLLRSKLRENKHEYVNLKKHTDVVTKRNEHLKKQTDKLLSEIDDLNQHLKKLNFEKCDVVVQLKDAKSSLRKYEEKVEGLNMLLEHEKETSKYLEIQLFGKRPSTKFEANLKSRAKENKEHKQSSFDMNAQLFPDGKHNNNKLNSLAQIRNEDYSVYMFSGRAQVLPEESIGQETSRMENILPTVIEEIESNLNNWGESDSENSANRTPLERYRDESIEPLSEGELVEFQREAENLWKSYYRSNRYEYALQHNLPVDEVLIITHETFTLIKKLHKFSMFNQDYIKKLIKSHNNETNDFEVRPISRRNKVYYAIIRRSFCSNFINDFNNFIGHFRSFQESEEDLELIASLQKYFDVMHSVYQGFVNTKHIPANRNTSETLEKARTAYEEADTKLKRTLVKDVLVIMKERYNLVLAEKAANEATESEEGHY